MVSKKIVAANESRKRNSKSLGRRSPHRKECERILIVCEGKKTEPNYFNEIRKKLNLSAIDIKITNSLNGTDPRSIVTYAQETFLKTCGYERVFIVFDRDSHATYFNAHDLIDSLNNKYKNDFKKKVPFQAIASISCFELWILLHFRDVSEFIDRVEVMKLLKEHFPLYDKAATNIYTETLHKRTDAIARAKRLCDASNPRDDKKPYTNVYELEELLLSFKT
jgi:hypothetical protein